MTRTANPPASTSRRTRHNDTPIETPWEGRGSAVADARIAARLARYAGDPPPSRAEPRVGRAQHNSRARDVAPDPVAQSFVRQTAANPERNDTLTAADTARRIEAVIATATETALAHMRADLAERTRDIAPLLAAIRRLETLETLPATLTHSVATHIDQRLDAVDDHLADLTQTLASHSAWDFEHNFARVHDEVATLSEVVHENARTQLSESIVRQILQDVVSARPQLELEDLEASITRPVLAAIHTAVTRLTGPHPHGAGDSVATEADAAFVDSVRNELATARAGQTEDIQKVETRLTSLQDSVVALTEQLRFDREASERADGLAHANAMAFAATRELSSASAFDQSAASHVQEHSRLATGTADLPGTPGLPRAAQLIAGDNGSMTEAESQAEAKSRFIVAARRASARARDPQRSPASNNAVARRPSAAIGATKRKALTRWLRGKGLLWAAAVLVTAGAMPLLAPALRALPGALIEAAGGGPNDGAATLATRTPAKIGSQLATAAASHPTSIVDDPAALYALGDRIAEGSSVGSPKLAASLLEKAAERGQAPAQYRIARLYEKGAGVPKDVNRARNWYVRAADQGNIRAMHNLAVLHAEGATGNVDYATAGQWFRKAAERGLADSQYNLAVLLARGLGGAANPGEAWVWFDIGARNGDSEAAARRDEIGATLTPAALEASRANAANWRLTPANNQANDPPAAKPQNPPGVSAVKDKSQSALPV